MELLSISSLGEILRLSTPFAKSSRDERLRIKRIVALVVGQRMKDVKKS